jgi:uncharacterized protein (TIGR03382 family)
MRSPRTMLSEKRTLTAEATSACTGSNADAAVNNLSITPVPGPSTYTALAVAMALSVVLLRRRRNAVLNA